MSGTESTPNAPRRILLIQAHPDDAEFTSGGTMAKWAKDGAEIHYCSITSGDRGSDDPDLTSVELAAMREVEQRAACDILGVKEVHFLRYEDGTLVADLDLRRALVRVIRQVRPDVILTFDPTARIIDNSYINHPDHIAAGEASLAAAFPSSGNRMYFTDLLAEGLEPHTAHEVYLYATEQANAWIDITGTMDTKIAALRAHSCQLKEWDPTEMIQDWARRSADANPNRMGAGTFAESFRYIRLD